jgi:hypothetical protein
MNKLSETSLFRVNNLLMQLNIFFGMLVLFEIEQVAAFASVTILCASAIAVERGAFAQIYKACLISNDHKADILFLVAIWKKSITQMLFLVVALVSTKLVARGAPEVHSFELVVIVNFVSSYLYSAFYHIFEITKKVKNVMIARLAIEASISLTVIGYWSAEADLNFTTYLTLRTIVSMIFALYFYHCLKKTANRSADSKIPLDRRITMSAFSGAVGSILISHLFSGQVGLEIENLGFWYQIVSALTALSTTFVYHRIISYHKISIRNLLALFGMIFAWSAFFYIILVIFSEYTPRTSIVHVVTSAPIHDILMVLGLSSSYSLLPALLGYLRQQLDYVDNSWIYLSISNLLVLSSIIARNSVILALVPILIFTSLLISLKLLKSSVK